MRKSPDLSIAAGRINKSEYEHNQSHMIPPPKLSTNTSYRSYAKCFLSCMTGDGRKRRTAGGGQGHRDLLIFWWLAIGWPRRHTQRTSAQTSGNLMKIGTIIDRPPRPARKGHRRPPVNKNRSHGAVGSKRREGMRYKIGLLYPPVL
jgi:hypothetical protein